MDIIYRTTMPSIDLHGEDSVSAVLLVREFLNDNYKLGNEEIVIVHGVGKGILKKEVHKVLKKDERIVCFGIDHFNSGRTLVRMASRIDKNQKLCYNMRHKLKGEL